MPRRTDIESILIIGSGPIVIGQACEFDYSGAQACRVLRSEGFRVVLVNSNPATIMTDPEFADRTYIEPLPLEDVLNVIAVETAAAGGVAPKVIVSLGGQTPLKLAGLLPPGMVAGTAPAAIDLAEDRERWNALCSRLAIPLPPGGTALTEREVLAVAERVGYPVLLRPIYVLGGRAMRIVHDGAQLSRAMEELGPRGSLRAEGGLPADRPVMVDRFLEDAIEVDVDAIRDHTGEVLIGGVMEHVEEAGVHSGYSACAIPPQTLQPWVIEVISAYTRAIAAALDVRGLLNVQFAVAGTTVYVIEANPRASRTVPFVAKATGVPLAKIASRVMLGASLQELRTGGILKAPVSGRHVSVKEAVLPLRRFPDVDAVLGPEMRSTGEVMGIDTTFGRAFLKAQTAAGTVLPSSGTVFLSLADRDKPAGLVVARRLREQVLALVATSGTGKYLARFGEAVDRVIPRLGASGAGAGRNAVELIECGEINFVVNTPRGSGPRSDGQAIRRAANAKHVPLVTTIAAALAWLRAWPSNPAAYQRCVRCRITTCAEAAVVSGAGSTAACHVYATHIVQRQLLKLSDGHPRSARQTFRATPRIRQASACRPARHRAGSGACGAGRAGAQGAVALHVDGA